MRIGRYTSHMNVSLLINVGMSQSIESSMKIVHDKLGSKIVKHASMDYENWLHFAEQTSKQPSLMSSVIYPRIKVTMINLIYSSSLKRQKYFQQPQ